MNGKLSQRISGKMYGKAFAYVKRLY